MKQIISLEDAVKDCYLCGKKLDSMFTSDHIIPDKLFHKNDPHRPTLPVHHKCNNAKSLDDEWFIKQLQLRSSFNPEAEQEFSNMIYKAKKEQPDAYIIGKKLHHYRLAMGIFNKVTWGLELPHKGQRYMQMKIDNKDVERFRKYVETMCRGLFIRNIPLSNPATPKLIMKQYVDLQLRGKDDVYIDSIKEFGKHTKFSQSWGDRILYFGSPVTETRNKGFLFIQFYNQFTVLAVFK